MITIIMIMLGTLGIAGTLTLLFKKAGAYPFAPAIVSSANKFVDIAISRGHGEEDIVFSGRYLGCLPSATNIRLYEAEEGYYVILNNVNGRYNVLTFSDPLELKGHIFVDDGVAKFFRDMRQYNPDFAEIVQHRLENPLLTELHERCNKEEQSGELYSQRPDDGVVVRSAQSSSRSLA